MRRILQVALLGPLVLVSLLAQPALAAPGFHAAWVDQSPWPVLRPGVAVGYMVHFRNTGTETWQRGVAGRQVNLRRAQLRAHASLGIDAVQIRAFDREIDVALEVPSRREGRAERLGDA